MMKFCSIATLLLAAVALTAVSAKVDIHEYVTAQVREEVVAQAVSEAKMHSDARKNRVVTQAEKDGKYTASQLLSKFFKRASSQAVKIGESRLRYEDMVHRAERKLLEFRRKAVANTQSKEERAETIAQELFHEPGSLLNKDELVHMWQESGCQVATPVPNCNFPTSTIFRTIDGTCNNRKNPLFGSAGSPFKRLTPAEYEDGRGSLNGELQSRSVFFGNASAFQPPYPSARFVSDTVVRDRVQDELPFTHILMQWGQFLDHDLDLSPELEAECVGCEFTEICEPIRVPDLDKAFGKDTPNNANCLPFKRSLPACDVAPPLTFVARQQTNDITSFIDASMVYGSRDEVAIALRELEGGLLRTGEEIPEGQETLPIDNLGIVACPNRMDCFLCGDIRCNEQISLTTMHTIWLREHNRCARELARINSFWDDERLYQTCRKIVGALIQKITYEDYLPKILGPSFNTFIGTYAGYDPTIDATIPNSFATAAYRYGHSLIRPFFDRLGLGYTAVLPPLNLRDAFFNPSQFRASGGSDPLIRGLVNTNSRRVDEFLNIVLTTQLFQTDTSPGLDLASLNIQRGRDHGLAPYTKWRNFCRSVFGLVTPFENELTAVRFLQAYGSLDTVDLWIGGLAEERLPESLLGPTFACIFGLTFNGVREGDAFWYQRPGIFLPAQVRSITQDTLSGVICSNTNIEEIQPDAYLSNQTRIPCERISRTDLSLFREEPCFFRARVQPREVDFLLSVYARVNLGFAFTSGLLPASREPQFICQMIQCPLADTPVDVVAFGNSDLLQFATVESDPNLPPSSLTDIPGAYRGDWPRSQFEAGQGGVFFSKQECEASSQIALTYSYRNLPAGTAEEQLLVKMADHDHDHDKSEKYKPVPEEINEILTEPNERLQKESIPEKNIAKVASDEMLLKELEDAMKSLQ